jgi:hypothetical protein
MALNLEAIETVFRKNIRMLLALPENSVWRANQQNPPQVEDQSFQFCTVLVQQIGPVGWDEVGYQDVPAPGNPGFGQGGMGGGGYGNGEVEDVNEFITGTRRFMASVQFFRGNALTRANSLTQLLQSTSSLQALQAAGIGLVKIGAVRNLSQVVDTYFENRAQIDIEFNVVSQEQTDMPTYGEFEFAPNFES